MEPSNPANAAASAAPDSEADRIWEIASQLFRPHPWHGVEIGPEAPALVTAFVEIVPTDTVKYEIDKRTGYLKVDRPQKFSSVCPTLYGFLPQTYCAERVAAFSAARTGAGTVRGDGDPLDICILSERSFSRGDFLLQAIPIGGLRLLDHDEADDKIVAVLKGDAAFGHLRDIGQVSAPQIERLKHYFLTYKRAPTDLAGDDEAVAITHVFGQHEAFEVIERSREDYREHFPDLKERLLKALRG